LICNARVPLLGPAIAKQSECASLLGEDKMGSTMSAAFIHRRRILKALGFTTAACLLPRPGRSLVQQPSAGLAHDPLRPEYHFLAPRDWMNDPNGPIFWKGKYHLFYQLHPGESVSGIKYWGHAVSSDMVHWQHKPIALSPTPGGADALGCWSGSAVVLNGVPAFLYTAIQAPSAPQQASIHEGGLLRETQMLAIAQDDDLINWKKDPVPVVLAPPAGATVTGFRDPCPWREADGWYLAVGSGLYGGGGRVLLYRSQDLRHWDYLHPLAEGQPGDPAVVNNPVGAGDMWECPDFFAVNGHHCLLYSCQGKAHWTTGRYDPKTHRYTALQHGVLDHGAFYAPKSFQAPEARRILWGWITESRPKADFSAAGWAGAISLPRVLTVNAQGQLECRVAAEVEILRGKQERLSVKAGTPFRRSLSTLRQELALTAGRPSGKFTLRLLVGGSSAWELTLDYAANSVLCGSRSFPIPASPLPDRDLRLFLDASVIEAFVGGRQAITSRVYTLKPGETELQIEVVGEGSLEFDLWPLQAISPDRLTT